MELFKFVRKNPKSCNCGGSCTADTNARFIVLGTCCKKALQTFENTQKAVAELGLSGEVANIGDAAEIAKYGVMQTPALVIDGKVVSYGTLLSVEAVKSLIQKQIG